MQKVTININFCFQVLWKISTVITCRKISIYQVSFLYPFFFPVFVQLPLKHLYLVFQRSKLVVEVNAVAAIFGFCCGAWIFGSIWFSADDFIRFLWQADWLENTFSDGFQCGNYHCFHMFMCNCIIHRILPNSSSSEGASIALRIALLITYGKVKGIIELCVL